MKRHSVFLVGPMGAGKSTIGRLLSSELQCEFIDSDKEIEERCGADIPWIFDMEGEVGFREREEQVIDELTKLSGIVLATGGGAVMRDINRQHLGARGTVVYLCTSVAQQLARTEKDKIVRYYNKKTRSKFCGTCLPYATLFIAKLPILLSKLISATLSGLCRN